MALKKIELLKNTDLLRKRIRELQEDLKAAEHKGRGKEELSTRLTERTREFLVQNKKYEDFYSETKKKLLEDAAYIDQLHAKLDVQRKTVALLLPLAEAKLESIPR